jgi:drug/metabolite transporter (DMT)-like permease
VISTGKFFEAGMTVFLFGCVPVVIKYISANAYTIGIFRLGLASLCMIAFLWAKDQFSAVGLRDLLILAIMGSLFGSHWLAHFISVKIASPSIASIGLSTYGIHLILLTRLVSKNKVSISDIIAVFLAISGCVLIIPKFSLSNDTTIGACLGIISGFFYALLPILHQKYSQISSSMRAFGQFFFGFIFFSFFFPLSEWKLPRGDWVWMVLLAVLGTFIAHTLWVRVTTTLSTKTTSLLFYLFVPIAMILSSLLLDEPMGKAKVIGATLIIAGNIFGLSRQWKKEGVLAAAVKQKATRSHGA